MNHRVSLAVSFWLGMEIASMLPRQYLEGYRADSDDPPRLLLVPFVYLLYTSLLTTSVDSYRLITTFSDGCLGSNNDEGRSEV